MKTAPSMNTVDFFTFCELHQLWQAVILKPLKLEECILHFWKSPIFINVVPTSQGHSCFLNTEKSILKIAGFITVSLLGVYILFSMTVGKQQGKNWDRWAFWKLTILLLMTVAYLSTKFIRLLLRLKLLMRLESFYWFVLLRFVRFILLVV